MNENVSKVGQAADAVNAQLGYLQGDIMSLSTEATAVVAQGWSSVQVTDQASHAAAVGAREALDKLRSRINGVFAPIVKAAYEAHKAAVAARDSFLDPLDKVDAAVKMKVATYEFELRRKAEEDRRAAEALGATDLLEEAKKAEEAVVMTTYMKDSWSAQVINLRALCLAVAEGAAPEELVMPNQVALNFLARSAKSTLTIPGVAAVNTPRACQKPT
jgi:hypothetical protein